MLDAIRSNTQSLGVKLAFGLIILVFVFWGVGNLSEGDTSRLMAKVNGESILEPDFYRQYNRLHEQFSRQGITREEIKAQHLGRSLLQNMIARTLVTQEAERLGLRITPLELRLAIEKNPVFLNEKGVFTKETYERGLAALRISAKDFEAEMSNDLLFEKMLRLVTTSLWVPADSARQRFDFIFEKRTVDAIFFPAKDFASKVSVTDEEKKAFYEENKNLYSVPKKAAISYVRLTAEKLGERATITDAAIDAYYAAHTSDFTTAEAVRVAHILVPLSEGATKEERESAEKKIASIQKELASGKSFALVADANNMPGAADKGGELGWIERGVTVEPFEKAAFSQKIGRVSDKAVETKFGLHLLLVHEHRDASVTPKDKVAEDIRKKLALEAGRDQLTQVGETLLEETLLGHSMKETAERFGLTVEESGPLSKAELVKNFSLSQTDADLILSGIPVDTLLQSGDDVLVVKVGTMEAERIKPLTEVLPEITESLIKKKSLELAVAEAEAVRADLESGKRTPSDVQKQVSTETLDRHGAITDCLPDKRLMSEIFLAKQGTWLHNVFTLTKKDGEKEAALFSVKAIQKAGDEEWKTAGKILESGAEREVFQKLRALFIEDLFRKAKITNVNFEKADRYDG